MSNPQEDQVCGASQEGDKHRDGCLQVYIHLEIHLELRWWTALGHMESNAEEAQIGIWPGLYLSLGLLRMADPQLK